MYRVKELKLSIPNYISEFLDKLASAKDAFIIEAITSYMQDPSNSASEQLMIESYKDENTESRLLKQEFVHVDSESWDDY